MVTSASQSPGPGGPGGPGAPVLAEVVARLGDRVVDVQHLGVEPDPAISSAGWCTIGACAMVLGLGLLVAGVSAAPPATPDPSDPSLDATVEPAAPARGAGPAGIGALLILLGVIPVTIGVRPRAVPRDRYMIGEGPDVHLPVALPGAGDGVALVRALERQIVLGLVPGLTGQIRDGERSTELADLLAQGRSSYALPPGATCEADLGALRFSIQAVERAALEPAHRSLDRLYFASNFGALALIGGALLLGEPRVAGELEVEEVAASRERAVRYLREVPPPPPPPAQPPPPVLPDRPSRAAAKPTPAAPPSGSPPPPTLDTLATEVADSRKIAPKGSRRGISNDYDFARTAGFLDDPAFNESVRSAQADAQEGMLGYDNEADRKMWASVLAAPVIDRPFGGLTLAETERGGGLHDDRPKPAKGPAKRVEVDALAKPEGPSAEARKLARRIVSIEFERPYVKGEGLPSHVVQESVRKQEAGLRQCFKEAVGISDRTGTIIMVINVGARGRVSSARLDFGGARLGDIGPCVTRVVRGWTFPEPSDRKPFAIAIEGLFSVQDR